MTEHPIYFGTYLSDNPTSHIYCYMRVKGRIGEIYYAKKTNYTKSTNYIKIYDIHVYKPYRRTGIGTKLLTLLERHSWNKNIPIRAKISKCKQHVLKFFAANDYILITENGQLYATKQPTEFRTDHHISENIYDERN